MSTETRPDLDQQYTAEEFYNLNLPDGEKLYELEEGKVIEMSPAGRRHSKISIRLSSRLQLFVEERDLGEVSLAMPVFRLARRR